MPLDERYRAEFNDFVLIHPPAYFRPLVDELLKAVSINNRKVLELGCGTGALLAELARESPSELTGVDTSSAAIEKARALLAPPIRLWCGDLSKPPQELTGQDVVVTHSTLQYIPHLKEILLGVFAVLRPGGVFFGTLEHKKKLDPLNCVQWLGFMAAPRFLRRRSSWIVKPMLQILGRKIPSAEVLDGKARYLGIPAVNCLSAKEVRDLFEAAGFQNIRISAAPFLDENSVPHHLIIATKPNPEDRSSLRQSIN